MKQLAIKAENISKQYRLGEVGTGTLTHDLNRFWSKVRGKEDPYLQIGESNDRSQKGNSDYVWSLRDINFEIEQGDAVGIIGRNGAGKSTLLKLLSKVTKPTTGNFKVNGRIASLLEVGTGFNPEMTGRENIYLNGAILGMRRAEITRKFDEIVDFAGVERYIDTPVKRYSSGMYVRLAFAVAAHLESEILIVDEVLAVGDAEFQKKCLGKMGDVSKGEGRTVLFVSHNMDSIKQLCSKGIYLRNGSMELYDKIDDTIGMYLSHSNNMSSFNFENDFLRLESLGVYSQGKKIDSIFNGIDIEIEVIFYLKSSNVDFGFCFALYNHLESLISAINTYHYNEQLSSLNEGYHSLKFIIPKYTLNIGEYYFNFHVNDKYGNLYKIINNCLRFYVVDDTYRNGKYFRSHFPGAISLVPEFNFVKL